MKIQVPIRARYRSTVSLCVVLVLCVCVLSQLLGVTVMTFGLLTSAEAVMEPVSEDLFLPPTVPELGMSRRPGVSMEFLPSFQLPVFDTSVFHPPPLQIR
jgi:hypothetical protein